MANALYTSGKHLFTAPSQKLEWDDTITAIESILLGGGKYKEVLAASGLSLIEKLEDEGGEALLSCG